MKKNGQKKVFFKEGETFCFEHSKYINIRNCMQEEGEGNFENRSDQ